jgi:D-beta-D-heptose 7-phosphate kinase/D-beta-D-heptose 1-phosphate adenosyltransferase
LTVPDLSRFAGRRILIIGDAMLDHYIWGDVSRISPEAPVPVVKVQRESQRLGGAANVAHNVRALGGRPALVAVIGRDQGGRQLGRVLRERRIPTEHLFVSATLPTILKTRVIARSQQVVRIDREDVHETDGELCDALSQRIAAALPSAEAVLISDYGKGAISRRLLETWLPRFRQAGLPVCVDPKETHFHRYLRVTVLTPNLKEASFAAGHPICDAESLEEAGRRLLRGLRAEKLLITRGEEGMSLFRVRRKTLHIPSVASEVYDVTGAGDTVVSALALGLAAGLAIEDATRVANHAAGLVIRELGTATTAVAEILASMNAHAGPPPGTPRAEGG